MKTILITGGSRGIGLAIAEKYLKTEEYNVIVTGWKEQPLEEFLKEVDNKNFHTIAAKADDEEAADKTCKDVNEKFSGMINALSYGAPPHGGMAPGIDRIVMLLANEKNIREVTLFPMKLNAQDLLMGSPSKVSEKQ